MEEDKVEKYIEWVVSKIDYLEEYSQGLRKKDANIHDLKEILSQRLYVSLSLNAEYQRYKTMHQNVLIDYNIFWDEKFTLTRRTLNPSTLASGKYASKAEIESETRYTHKDEYLKFKKELVALDNRVSFLRRLMDQWEKVSFDVNNYIKLIELEVYGLNNMSATEKTKKRVRTRN